MRMLSLCLIISHSLAQVSELGAQGIPNFPYPRQWQNLHLPLDSWGLLTFEAENSGAQAEEVFLTSYFTERSHQQFGRRFWLPPNSIRQQWCLVHTPVSDGKSSEQEVKTLNSMVIRRHGAIESSVANQFSERFESGFIRCRKDASKTLLVMNNRDHDVQQLVAAARLTQKSPKSYHISTTRPLPPEAAAYEGWTHIILATNSVLADRAAAEALRQWIVRGGNLWILLDKTGLETARPFLADAGGLAVVDRVGLTSLKLSGKKNDFFVSEDIRELESPVDLVRVVPEGFDDLCQIDGWNVALSTQVGAGRILITTLGPRGWLRPRVLSDARRWEIELSETGYPTEACLSLGKEFWGAEQTATTPLDVAGIPTSYVGYRVTSLTWVASALAMFCVSMLFVGLVLWRSSRLAWLAWIAPAASLLATVSIGISGHQARTAIPPTEASVQRVEADSLGQLRIQGGLSVYSASSGDTLPETTRGGRLEFADPPGGVAKRLVWSDYGNSHWENLELNTGIHEFRFETFEAQAPSQAILSLNDQGVIGRIAGGEWELPRRGLIVTPSGQFAAPRFLEGGRFVGSADDVLPAGQFSASDVIDDREQTRTEVLQKLFADGKALPGSPRLYFWTKSLEIGMRTQSEGRRVGDALVGLPLIFEPPPAGTEVYCPSYLIGFRSVTHPGRGASTAFDNRDHQWNDLLLRKGSTTLEFQMPPNLGRLKWDRLRVFVDIQAPNRTFQLRALDRDNRQEQRELATRKSPVGQLVFDLEEGSLPAWDEESRFRLGFDVGPFQDDVAQEIEADRARHAWQFKKICVEAWGRAPE